MARTTTTSKVQFTANGATTAFAYSFPMVSASYAVVTLTDLTGVETTQTNPSNYTITVNSVGGTVTFVTAPTNGYKVTIRRVEPITQLSDWSNGAAVSQQTFEDAVDKLTDLSVQLQEQLDRSPKFKLSSTFLNKQFPELVAKKAIRVSDDGQTLVCSTNDFDTLLQDTTVQANLAIAAKTSSDATAALVLTQYNTVVADAAQVASDKITVAADKATVIADMNTVASDKATVAADKAIVIADMNTVAVDKAVVIADMNAANTSATNAATSEANALTYKNSANTSATNAATSETNALTYKNASNTSATNAATSATLANDWAQKIGTTVDGSGYSAKYWAQQASAAANVFTYSNIAVSGQNTIVADQNNDTLTFTAGSNITLTTNDTTDTLTVAVSGLGSAAALNVGTAANNVVQLNGSSQLPAVSGVNVTNVNAAQLGGYTIGVGANGILQLNGSSQIPAVSGALVTNLNGSNITSGTVPTARLGSGTASSSTYLRGDSSWAAIDLSTKVNLAGDTMTGQLVGTTFKSNGTTATSSGFKIANGNDLGTLYKDISYSAVQSGVGAGYTTAVTVSGTVMTITTNCNLCPNCNYQPNCNCNCCC